MMKTNLIWKNWNERELVSIWNNWAERELVFGRIEMKGLEGLDEEMKILNTSKKENNKELQIQSKYIIFFSGAAGID